MVSKQIRHIFDRLSSQFTKNGGTLPLSEERALEVVNNVIEVLQQQKEHTSEHAI